MGEEEAGWVGGQEERRMGEEEEEWVGEEGAG